MIRKRMILFIVLALLFGLLIGTIASAGFIDDWIQQRTETSPGYFEGQKRGYFTGGNFSARWPMKNDHLISVEAPRFKMGCGGIDIFMGGLSFLNFDYLVQKLQRILQAAPAAAFDLALKTLCEQCSTVMKSMEDFSDKLNNLQLDDCQTSRVMVAKLFNAFSDNPQIQAEAEQDFSLKTGLSDLYTSVTNTVTSSGGYPPIPDNKIMFDGCSDEIKQIFLAAGKSILQTIGEKRGYPADYIALMRGFLGDVDVRQVTDTGGNVSIQLFPVPPCPGNSPNSLDDFFAGTARVRPLGGDMECIFVSDANKALGTWAYDKLLNVFNSMKTKRALAEEDTNFINAVPLVYQSLKLAAATKQGDQVLTDLSDVVAKAYAYGMIRDLYAHVRYNFSLAKTILEKKGQNQKDDCHMTLLTAHLPTFELMINAAGPMAENVKADYTKSLSEHQVLIDTARRYEEFNKTSHDKLSRAFTPALANRVLSGM